MKPFFEPSAAAASVSKVFAEPSVGDPYPLGATLRAEGVNFSVFAGRATGVQLVFFDHADSPMPSHVVTLDSNRNRTSDYWHVFVPGIKAGQRYGFRVDGPTTQQADNDMTLKRFCSIPMEGASVWGRPMTAQLPAAQGTTLPAA
jgi:pullulanase/glycogen debranching enzyme